MIITTIFDDPESGFWSPDSVLDDAILEGLDFKTIQVSV